MSRRRGQETPDTERKQFCELGCQRPATETIATVRLCAICAARARQIAREAEAKR